MGEFLLTIMSSLSQEESRSISKNVKWGQRKRFADGKCSVSFSHFLGYDQDAEGNWVINEEEAKRSGRSSGCSSKGFPARRSPTG